MKRILAILSIAVALLIPLYFIASYNADDAAQYVKDIKNDIRLERNMQQTLRAEWSSLNDPRRLQKLAKQYLDLRQHRVSQIDKAWVQKSPATLTSLKEGETQSEPSR